MTLPACCRRRPSCGRRIPAISGRPTNDYLSRSSVSKNLGGLSFHMARTRSLLLVLLLGQLGLEALVVGDLGDRVGAHVGRQALQQLGDVGTDSAGGESADVRRSRLGHRRSERRRLPWRCGRWGRRRFLSVPGPVVVVGNGATVTAPAGSPLPSPKTVGSSFAVPRRGPPRVHPRLPQRALRN